MPGLKDVVRVTKEVHGVTVGGISARDVAQLFQDFPQLGSLSTGTKITAGQLMEVAQDAVGKIISFGANARDNDDEIEIAHNLPIYQQYDIIEAILPLTFPDGVSSFVKRLQNAQASAVVPGADGKAPDMKSPPQSPISSSEDSEATPTS